MAEESFCGECQGKALIMSGAEALAAYPFLAEHGYGVEGQVIVCQDDECGRIAPYAAVSAMSGAGLFDLIARGEDGISDEDWAERMQALGRTSPF